MKPNIVLHNPDPQYIRHLLDEAGLNQCEAARVLGITPRSMRHYVAIGDARYSPCPYSIQYCLEALAGKHIASS
jgi:hypothetical protein